MNCKQMATLLLTLSVLSFGSISTAAAAIKVYEFDNPQQEAQFYGLIEDLRCPTCQNQNLASSDAPIAQDLKQKTYEMVKAGRTDSEIREFMFERYGDFISYRPPVRPSTWILWFFPPILLVILLVGWMYRTRQKMLNPTSTKTEQTALSDTEKKRLEQILSEHSTNTSKAFVDTKASQITSDDIGEAQ